MTARRTCQALALALLAGGAALTPAAEVVILKDGFVVQGNVRKESETVFDKATGTAVRMVKANGLDMIDEGPKVTVFSTHAKLGGEVNPDTKLRPEYKAYTMKPPGRKANTRLPAMGEITKVTDFNAKWLRTLTVPVANAAPEQVEQMVTYIDPYFLYVWSPTHIWGLTYRTNEWDPAVIRKLLLAHPELAEPDGKCDPLRRVALGKFWLDAGWLQLAKDEMDRLKRDFVGEMAKDAKEAHEKLLKEIDGATAELAVREAELAHAAGRYRYAADILAEFPEKLAGRKEVERAAKVGAELKAARERYDAARRLLAALVEEVGGWRAAKPLHAAGGGPALAAWKSPKVTADARALAAAGAQVLAELHPDSAARIETFVTLAAQAERERAADRAPTKTPAELLATAASGWAMGRNGATPSVEAALKVWAARELILAYQRCDTIAGRAEALARFKKSPGLDTPQIAQLVSLLPPAQPEDLDARSGKAVKLGGGGPTGVYRRKSGPVPGHPLGIDYLVKLPPEYHHGRAYPVLIVLSHPGVGAENMLASLMAEADRHGYIVVAPEWTGEFAKGGWEWKGDDHVYVTAPLRDAVRHFTVDNDRVFLCGAAEGANMAVDVGSSHPDLFAGVVAVSPILRWQGQLIETWRNAQKLPFYVVTGELASASVAPLKSLFGLWMPHGFPAVMAVYKGRGIEWYPAETPVFFDWMSRKKRVNGTATLALGTSRQPWQMLREADNRFYWLEATRCRPGKNGGAVVTAEMLGDLKGNSVEVRCRGVQQLTVWLSSDMIDWTKPVRATVNGTVPVGFKPKMVEPNLEVLLEDYYERGDRRMLFLNKLEIEVRGS